jgi:serine/threonine-protein kinase HipA
MQTLGALAHFDFNQAGAYSYEQAMQLMRKLGLGMDAIEQQFRRMVFNIVARNQDDHVKNIAFLMDRNGAWSLAPAFDVTYSYNPDGRWTSSHQMTMNGKRGDFALEDFEAVGRAVSLKRGRAREILAEVTAAIRRWPAFADTARVEAAHVAGIQTALRLSLQTGRAGSRLSP